MWKACPGHYWENADGYRVSRASTLNGVKFSGWAPGARGSREVQESIICCDTFVGASLKCEDHARQAKEKLNGAGEDAPE